MNEPAIHVVKLGGSLLDGASLPELATRFEAWRRAQPADECLVLLVGGGAAADLVRDFDQAFHLDEERAHWLAIRAMQLNAFCAAAALGQDSLAGSPQACAAAWARGARLAVVDPWEWLSDEDRRGIRIPHRWTFTSDSIAAHLATRLGAAKLTLLKSTLPQGPCDPARAAKMGVVDEDFPAACAPLPHIELVNLRSTPPGRCGLR